MSHLEVIIGDITKLEVDAIVNAANTSLLGGGGVDGAIQRAAGPGLLEECKKLNGCKTGEAKITAAYNLPSKYIIHTAGPVWQGGNHEEEQLLANCYKNSLALAIKHNIKSIAFPNISTGIYCFPKQLAATIAIATTLDFVKTHPLIEKIYFVCFDQDNYQLYQRGVKKS
ncbi:O-acetyl-ADP-ribose deacetylase [Solitalea koreensis]|uniref:O-acetyl-ADP-ribose deacetylase (Regulator of RNase III), contains Macro domain n=1 Tax=Solitalea koreensis TaxID=543615 RepID=A0A521B0S1_9SPHI|nr:O-acetyl-ADP-ribose deacetylase [Solitalea koreensis]SMO40682.1 O-acetyl-ADP-ribose deacetylase (regulator of RNase III), contains Macro domain [Solitalea koreensis]